MTMFRKLIFPGAAVAGLCMAVPAAHANPPVKTTMPDDFILFDSCTGENVHFVGEVDASVAISIQNGIAHVQIKERVRDTGTGQTSGGTYKANANFSLEENIKQVNNTGEANDVRTMPIIGQGNIPNESLMETFHFTINANGTITVTRDNMSIVCHG